MTSTEKSKECGERLYDAAGKFVATCTEPWGMEHSHSDHEPAEAGFYGKARALSVENFNWGQSTDKLSPFA